MVCTFQGPFAIGLLSIFSSFLFDLWALSIHLSFQLSYTLLWDSLKVSLLKWKITIREAATLMFWAEREWKARGSYLKAILRETKSVGYAWKIVQRWYCPTVGTPCASAASMTGKSVCNYSFTSCRLLLSITIRSCTFWYLYLRSNVIKFFGQEREISVLPFLPWQPKENELYRFMGSH